MITLLSHHWRLGENKDMKEAKIYCPHCYKIIELEQDEMNKVFVIEENEIE